MVYLRGGVGNFQNELQFDNTKKLSFQPNLGVGFKYKGIAIDYAITDIGDQSVALYSNVFRLIDLGYLEDKHEKITLLYNLFHTIFNGLWTNSIICIL